MEIVYQIIEQLDSLQAEKILELVQSSFDVKNNSEKSFPNEEQILLQVDEEWRGDFAKLMLFEIINLKNEQSIYLKKQLINNAGFLEEERQNVSERRSVSVEVLQTAVIVLALLGVDIQIGIDENKNFRFKISTGLLAISQVQDILNKINNPLKNTKNTISNSKNVITDSTIIIKGDFLIGDQNITNNNVNTIDDDLQRNNIQGIEIVLDPMKLQILEQFKITDKNFQKIIFENFQKMSEQESKIVEEALSQSQKMSLNEAENVLNTFLIEFEEMNKGQSKKIEMIQEVLKLKTNKISTKLKILISFLPFLAVVYEMNSENILNRLWQKSSNVVSLNNME